MKTRIEAARFAERLLNFDKDIKLVSKKSRRYFGKVELRTLFDFIWEGELRDPDEAIASDYETKRQRRIKGF